MRLNQRSAMYTTMESVQNKVGDVTGWKELLSAVGFRFESGNNSLPAAVFFPTTDPGDRLTQCSATMQALLGELCFKWGSAQDSKREHESTMYIVFFLSRAKQLNRNVFTINIWR